MFGFRCFLVGVLSLFFWFCVQSTALFGGKSKRSGEPFGDFVAKEICGGLFMGFVRFRFAELLFDATFWAFTALFVGPFEVLSGRFGKSCRCLFGSDHGFHSVTCL